MCKIITEVKDRIKECMIKANSFERDVLKTVLGEIQTIKSRTGKMDDDGVIKVFKKFKQGVEETIELLEKEGCGQDNSHLKVEIEVYDRFIPAVMSVDSIVKILYHFTDKIKNAKSDGQATGMAMGFLKNDKVVIPVDGKDVATAVKQIRSE